MRLRIVHETAYEYGEAVTTSHHEIHLTPRNVRGQLLLSHRIDVAPTPNAVHERVDYFGNRSGYFALHEPHRVLVVTARSEVELDDRRQLELPARALSWEEVRDQVARDRAREVLDAYAFTFGSRYVPPQPALAEYAAPSFGAGRPFLECAIDLTRRIHGEFAYDPSATDVSTPLAEVLQRRRGVCQDFAHLQIGCMRSLGLPARYVSGYLVTAPSPGAPRLVGADASHAWISTYDPAVGWVDFDPANGVVPSNAHVTVAYGCDYGDVSPVRGVILGGGKHSLRVSVDVATIEPPSS